MGENHQQAPHKKEYPPQKTILPVLLGRISILNFFWGGYCSEHYKNGHIVSYAHSHVNPIS